MTFQRRHLPHLFETGQPIFLTWRLHGSLPTNRAFPSKTITSGQAFAAVDRLLDEAKTGPFHLRQPEIANMVVKALIHGAEHLNHYELHAYVVMANHVHILITPNIPLPTITKSLKGITAKRANALLKTTGSPFWQEESYDHLIRTGSEFKKIQNYIEQNPVRAGVAKEAKDYQWSSSIPQPTS